MRTDINAFIGPYPFRDIGPSDAASLAASLAGVGVNEAWVSSLPAIFWRDPAGGNEALLEACAAVPGLRPVPAVHPGLPRWEDVLDAAMASPAPCVRCDPSLYALAPAGPEMRMLLGACGERDVALMMAVRLEDGRQRHPHDAAPPLEPWAIRGLVRADPRARLIVTHADREFIEQAHFGATPPEAERILWDISCVWGPPEDHLALLLETIGADRFAFGTGAPLRIPDSSAVKLEMLNASGGAQVKLERDNAAAFARRGGN